MKQFTSAADVGNVSELIREAFAIKSNVHGDVDLGKGKIFRIEGK